MTITETTTDIDTIVDLRKQVASIFDNPFSVTLFGGVQALLVDVRDNGVGKLNPARIEDAITKANQHMQTMTEAYAEISTDLAAVKANTVCYAQLRGTVLARLELGMPEISSKLFFVLKDLKSAITKANELYPYFEGFARHAAFIGRLQGDLARVTSRGNFRFFVKDHPGLETPTITVDSKQSDIDAVRNFAQTYWDWTKSPERLLSDRMGLNGDEAPAMSRRSGHRPNQKARDRAEADRAGKDRPNEGSGLLHAKGRKKR